MKLLLDTGVLGQVCHPRKHDDVRAWLQRAVRTHAAIVSEFADYELRRPPRCPGQSIAKTVATNRGVRHGMTAALRVPERARMTRRRYTEEAMPMTVRGHVRSGRLVVDVPTDLPEGSEVELTTGLVRSDPVRDALAAAPAGPSLTPEEQARLEAIAARGAVGAVPHDEIMRRLEERQRREP